MSSKFAKTWEKEHREPIFSRFISTLHQTPPLKERLTNSVYRLQVLTHRLGNTSTRLEGRDKEFFEKCAQAQMTHDQNRAMMYANEVAEIRKMTKVVLQSQMAIEQVILRLETVRDFGDVAAQIGPIVPLVSSIKHHLVGIMPEVSMELGTISDTLNSLVVEVGEATGSGYDVMASSEESQRILREASAVVETKMNEKFPELPPGLPSVERAGKDTPLK